MAENFTEGAWIFSDPTSFDSINEIHLAGAEQREEEGFIIKEVLRTGEWPAIPTKAGLVKKPLRIIRDGISDPNSGVIALSELVQNFEAGVIQNPQIPLSDDSVDHKNLTRLNTGFVRGLWIEDRDDGDSRLWAKMEFTEPEVKEKVLRGTYSDVSCGIPWGVTTRGQKHGATLEHVCITNRPFIDGLGPFLAASDNSEAEASHFTNTEVEETKNSDTTVVVVNNVDPPEPKDFAASLILSANEALKSQLGLSDGYSVTAVNGTSLFVANDEKTWVVPYTVNTSNSASPVTLSAFSDWTTEGGENDEPPVENDGSPESSEVQLSELEQARRLREIRLSQQPIQRAKEANMPMTREDLAALELSDDARAAIESIIEENASLRVSTREQEANRRVEELKDLGLAERPGFLKFYRTVMLSDDGGPAVVLSEKVDNQEQMSALEILDHAIEALKGSDEKVVLSDQALASGNDEKPPNTPGDELKPVDERTAEAREALYGKK